MKKKTTDLENAVKVLTADYFNHTKTHTDSGFLHHELMRRVERELIIQVLKHTENNQSQSAKILGISRTTLRKKLQQYQIVLSYID